MHKTYFRSLIWFIVAPKICGLSVDKFSDYKYKVYVLIARIVGEVGWA